MPHLTGLFLGAGASYEVGMPLAWELTAELKGHLTPSALHSLNDYAKSAGRGHSAEMVEELVHVMMRDDLHYEAILGWLETESRRSDGQRGQEFHSLHVWLVHMVYGLLYERQVRSRPFIERHISLLDGIARLAERNLPLWIFSLNHDLIIECLAANSGIAVNCGFSPELVTLPRRDPRGRKIGELQAETMTATHLEKTGLPFLRQGEL